ncbi:hypothetical protein B4N84_00445 [Flavobacterium sp. IR1]|nr:hypothetical protein B4N84_00445 [Flavobacterium sp. IR1]
MSTELFNVNTEIKHFFALQNNLREKVIKEDRFPTSKKYVVGGDVAYVDASDKLIGAIVVLDSISLKVVEEVSREI